MKPVTFCTIFPDMCKLRKNIAQKRVKLIAQKKLKSLQNKCCAKYRSFYDLYFELSEFFFHFWNKAYLI